MLVIRFFRTGKKHQPSFKIVVTEKQRSSTRGRFVEEVGFYNPKTKEKILRQDRIKYWLSVGAQLSDTVHNLLILEKIIEGKKIDVHKKKKEKEEKPSVETPVPTEEKPAEEKPAEEVKPKEEEKPEEEEKKSRFSR